MDKTNKRKKQQILSDEFACEVISKAVFNIVSKSEDADFIQKCHNVLQVTNEVHLQNKLKKTFMDVIKNNSTNEMISISTGPSEQTNDSPDSFLEDLAKSSTNVLEELDGLNK